MHFPSFHNIQMAHVAEIFPRAWQGPNYPAYPLLTLLMTWQRKEPGHQQPWYCIDLVGLEYTSLMGELYLYMRILVPEAGISGRDK